MTAWAAIAAGAALLVWPAFVNGYPLVFSDTGAFLHQTLGPLMIWDKPWIYGPMLHALHWRLTLWLPLAAQGLVVSHLLWLMQRCCRGTASAWGHGLLCAELAALTTLPFSAALLMPDILAPVALLALFLLGFGGDRLGRGERLWLLLLATLAIAAHLSHLPLAAALLVPTALLARAWRPVLAVAAPLAAALLLLLATNWVGHGRLAVSPYGASFLLARLVADGPAARTIEAECPARGWYLCAWAGRLPTDSDIFLWAADSPVNRDAAGVQRFLGGAMLAPEAGEILAATLRREPLGAARAVLGNALTQLRMTAAGDTLGREWLATAVRPRIAEGFPPRELAAYDAARQPQDALRGLSAPFATPHAAVLLLALVAVLAGLLRAARRGERRMLALALFILVGLAANAAATGGLSKPHPRYQARIAWLLPLGAALLWWPAQNARNPRPGGRGPG